MRSIITFINNIDVFLFDITVYEYIHVEIREHISLEIVVRILQYRITKTVNAKRCSFD